MIANSLLLSVITSLQLSVNVRMKILACVGEFAYGRQERGAGVEYSTLVPALRRLGHEVRVFDVAIRNRYHNYADLNLELFREASKFSPDLVITVVGDVEIWFETLVALRSFIPHVRMISWTTDDTWKYRQVSRHIARAYDGMTTTYADMVPSYHRDGCNQVLVTQWAANESWIRPPLPAKDCRHQVSFVGIAYGDRRRVVEALRLRGLPVTCFGYQWPTGPINSAQIPEIMQNSVISLNFSKGLYGGPNQIKARTFEVPGAGGFLLTENAPGLESWYSSGDEIAVWDNLADLERCIRYYLANPHERDVMAQRAHVRTLKEHRYDHRMAELVSWALALPPIKSQVVNFDEAVNFHRSSWLLSGGRRLIEYYLRPVIGKERARRYLRRLGFEIAWRTSGVTAFTAKGWFGRAFPPAD
jgi:spore maturation protein CgeB